MKLDAFISAVDKLVCEWNGNVHEPNAVPREALTAIYAEVREQAVHDVAVAFEQRARVTKHKRSILITLPACEIKL